MLPVDRASRPASRPARRLSPARLEHWQQRMPGAGVRQLARAMKVEPSTVTRAIARQRTGGR